MKNSAHFFTSGICSLFTLILIFFTATISYAATFSWAPNDPIEKVKGYKIYYSTQSGVYSATDYVNVGNVTFCEVEKTFAPYLISGTEYFFVITAYTCPDENCTEETITSESDYSVDELNYAIAVDKTMPSLDTDNDGLTDDNEIKVYGTDPNNADTDADGIADGDELALWGAEWNKDFDNDGIINLLDDDADSDGIIDGADESPGVVAPLFTSDSFPDGAAIKGKISYDHTWHTLTHNGNFLNPVVIAGPPTYNDPAAGIPRLSNITPDSFDIKFQKGKYLADQGLTDPGFEKSSYLVIEQGIHNMADGSTWEVGTFNLSAPVDSDKWRTFDFYSQFPAPPHLFLTIQTANDETPLIIRIRNLNESSFQAAIFTEEALTGEHGEEKIGYLAIYSKEPQGELYNETNSSPYSLAQEKVDHNFISIFSREIFLQEEQSADDDTWHVLEEVNALQIGTDFFAQIISCNGYDPITIRQRPSFYSTSLISDKWRTVYTTGTYNDPVVITGPSSYNDTEPGTIRLTDITSNSFDIKFQEWMYLQSKDYGIHQSENISWLMLEPGIYTMNDGSVWEVGKFQLNGLKNWQTFNFQYNFSRPPALYLTIQTYNGSDPVTVRVRSLKSSSFNAALFEEEARMKGGHNFETIGYLAISNNLSSGQAEVGSQMFSYEHSVIYEADNNFCACFDHEIKLDEETSLDRETSHIYEKINGLRINNALFGQIISCNGYDTVTLRLSNQQ